MKKKQKSPTKKDRPASLAVTSGSAGSLAKKLARAVFESGDSERFPVGRLQFMSGKWPFEIPRGGLCERALATQIAFALREIISSPNKKDQPTSRTGEIK